MSTSSNEMHVKFIFVFYYLFRSYSNDFGGFFFGMSGVFVINISVASRFTANIFTK